jgi:hypothetical protein
MPAKRDAGPDGSQMPHRRPRFVNLRFPPIFNPETARNQLDRLAGDSRNHLCVDLSRCESFDIVGLLRLVSMMAIRRERKAMTSFKLPKDGEARNYLRTRGFPAAIERVARVPFRHLVNGSWFEDDHTPSDSDFDTASRAIQAYLAERKFFNFAHYDIDDDDDRVFLVEREWRRWQNPLILEVLRNRLSPHHAHDVSRVIVQEMLTGLLTFVASGDVICVSQINEGHRLQEKPHLIIAAWHAPEGDVGAKLFDLLMSTINSPGRREVFELSLAQAKPRSFGERMDSLLSRFSGEYAGADREDLPTSGAGDVAQESAGKTVSIEALYRFVVDEFAGSIDLWSGTTFAQLSRDAQGGPHYRVDVRYKGLLPDAGNMIAVRLPLST